MLFTCAFFPFDSLHLSLSSFSQSDTLRRLSMKFRNRRETEQTQESCTHHPSFFMIFSVTFKVSFLQVAIEKKEEKRKSIDRLISCFSCCRVNDQERGRNCWNVFPWHSLRDLFLLISWKPRLHVLLTLKTMSSANTSTLLSPKTEFQEKRLMSPIIFCLVIH